MCEDLIRKCVVAFHEKVSFPDRLLEVVKVAHGEFYMVANGGLLEVSEQTAEEFIIPFIKKCVWPPVGVDHCAVFFGCFDAPGVEVIDNFGKFFGTSF